jgi:Ca2+-binding EF-hand superfamily protein
VLNIVTAIFVDTAMQSQQHYKELLIQENVAKKTMYTSHLREVFRKIDHDASGFVTQEEVEYFLMDPTLNLYLESIDIFPNDARALFQMLDDDESGEVSIDEFCDGCLRLKGEAKSYDIHCLLYGVRKLHGRIDDLYEKISPNEPEDKGKLDQGITDINVDNEEV